MNHPQFQFARSITPRVAAKAADARPSLLPASAATSVIHDQRDDHRRAGQPVWGRDDHLPVRVNLFRGQDLPERLGRGALLRSFSGRLSGCVNTRLANINDAVDHLLHNRSYRFPGHSKISVPFAHEHEAKGVGSDQEAIGVYQNVDC